MGGLLRWGGCGWGTSSACTTHRSLDTLTPSATSRSARPPSAWSSLPVTMDTSECGNKGLGDWGGWGWGISSVISCSARHSFAPPSLLATAKESRGGGGGPTGGVASELLIFLWICDC